MMHAMSTPADLREELARNIGTQAERLVDFLMRAVGTPAADGA